MIQIKTLVLSATLALSFSAVFANENKSDIKIKDHIQISENVKVGRIEAPKLDDRIHTDKDIRDHKDSMAGKDTVGITIEFD